jgi:hypothetical protein
MTVDCAFSTPVDAYSRPRARPAFPSLVPMDGCPLATVRRYSTKEMDACAVPVLCLCCGCQPFCVSSYLTLASGVREAGFRRSKVRYVN